MLRRIGLGVAVLAVLCLMGATTGVQAQAVRRESTIQGPGGRTIRRNLEVQRGGGTYQRDLHIQRPAGTLERSVTIQRGALPGWPPAGSGYRGVPMMARNGFPLPPPPMPPPPRPAGGFAFGVMAAPVVAMPFLGAGFGAPAPPPVVVAPMVVGQPVGVPVAVTPGTVGQASPLDPVTLSAQRLQSFHSSSRRDAATELGRIGDPRAIPALVNTLKHDSSKDVKISAATALGQIGGSEAEVVLERCIIYEKKQEVRDAAAAALATLRDRREMAAQAARTTAARSTQDSPRVASRAAVAPVPSTASSPFRSSAEAEVPALEAPVPGDSDSSTERVPPPPPTPVSPR